MWPGHVNQDDLDPLLNPVDCCQDTGGSVLRRHAPDGTQSAGGWILQGSRAKSGKAVSDNCPVSPKPEGHSPLLTDPIGMIGPSAATTNPFIPLRNCGVW